MNKLKSLMLLLVALITLPAMAQQLPQLPMDKSVRYGKLPNGLTYYIRHNALPENRANFYIAQKVGSCRRRKVSEDLLTSLNTCVSMVQTTSPMINS